MAILQGCPGIKVSIVSDSQPLEEYPDEDSEFNNKDFSAPRDHQALTYVECTSDAEFGIKMELTQDYDSYAEHTHFAFWAYVDGQGIGGVIDRLPSFGAWTYNLLDALGRISATEQFKRKLRFCSITKGMSHSSIIAPGRLEANLLSVDDGDSARVKDDVKLATGLGEIIVYVHRCNMEPLIERNYAPTSLATPPAEIAEKALKGQSISHGVRCVNFA
jgi:hypothetical protein